MAQQTKKPATRNFRGRSAETANAKRGSKPFKTGQDEDDRHLIYGLHSTLAALSNPDRQIDELYLTLNAENRIKEQLSVASLSVQRVTPKDLDKRLGSDTVHQGALAVCQPLPEVTLPTLIATAKQSGQPILVLDQITDPHNAGAVLRSAAAFGVSGLVMTRRHSPPLAGALAKVASGALEIVPICLIQNLIRGLAE
ncbi:MAG: RNA methyltransferase, partial [Pseudomonadota bacterium]